MVRDSLGAHRHAGNLVNDAGCSGSCQLEFCGDSIQQLREECDAGNPISEDGCSNVCFTEFCSDSVIQAGLGEQCDDGNTTPGDGCSATCQVEPPVLAPSLGEIAMIGLVVLLMGIGSALVIHARRGVV